MKKIGYVSVRNYNYGSLLQAFALQQYLVQHGIDNELIFYVKRNMFKQFMRLFNVPLLKAKIGVWKRKVRIAVNPKLKYNFKERNAAFYDFFTNKMICSRPYIGRTALKKGTANYSAFILGSDQVWNPMNYGVDFYTLTFIPREKLKVTYASSFGISSIPSTQYKGTCNFLRRIDNISVRELSGQKIVKDLIGREVPVVVDPTLLFNSVQWDKLLSEKRICSEQYIFCYFVGNNMAHRIAVKMLAKEMGLRLVFIPHVDEYVPEDNEFVDNEFAHVGPSEFVNLIKYANFICTDSFHATLFSIQYHKKFVVFDRYKEGQKGNMNTRLASILGILGLQNRRLNKYDETVLSQIAEDIDYEAVDKRLDAFKQNSYEYLANIISKLKETTKE